MLKNTKAQYTKEEELEFGKKVQLGIKAKKQLEEKSDLSSEEILELTKIMNEGEAARMELFETHINFANHLSQKMHKKTGTNYPLEDLQQDAYIALNKATLTYNPNKNCQLSTHAFYAITKALSVTINKMRSVRLPENRMGEYLFITRAEAEYMNEHEHRNNADMLEYVAEKTGLTKEIIITIKSAIKGAYSLNVPVGEGNSDFIDLLADKNTDNHEIKSPLLTTLLSDLTQYEQDIIALELRVGVASLSRSKFKEKWNIDDIGLEKESKRIVRQLKKKVKLEGVNNE